MEVLAIIAYIKSLRNYFDIKTIYVQQVKHKRIIIVYIKHIFTEINNV